MFLRPGANMASLFHWAHCPCHSVTRPPGSNQPPSCVHVRQGLVHRGVGYPLSPFHRYEGDRVKNAGEASGKPALRVGHSKAWVNTLHFTLFAHPCTPTASATIPTASCLSSLSRTSCRPSPLMSSGFSACAPTIGQVSWLLCAWSWQNASLG